MNRKKKYDAKFIRKSLRFTQKQYEHIEKQMKKTGENFTQYAHRIIVNKTTRVPIYQRAKIEVAHQINKIGNNLNQLAKIAHQTGNIQALSVFERIEQQLKELK